MLHFQYTFIQNGDSVLFTSVVYFSVFFISFVSLIILIKVVVLLSFWPRYFSIRAFLAHF